MNVIIPSPESVASLPAFGDERLPKRFWEKIRTTENGCWEWTAQIGHHGYARFQFAGKSTRAHRFAYEKLVGAILDGLVIDHTCRVRHCVNPAHLEPVTNAENLRRGGHYGRDKTHCAQGHPFDGENTGVDNLGRRFCRECHRAANRAWKARQHAAAKGGA